MSDYGSLSLDAYRDALASDSPTPGGVRRRLLRYHRVQHWL